jgi:membrane protein
MTDSVNKLEQLALRFLKSATKLESYKESFRTARFTAGLLRTRLREDHLAITAGSLTFTTALSIVPLFAVALTFLSAFPAFASFQASLQNYLIESLVPESIAQQITRYLTQFAGKAKGLTTAGLAVVLFTAVALMLTIDRTFNKIWRVRRPRSFTQRVLVYWGVITFGPVVLGAVFALTSAIVGTTKGLVGDFGNMGLANPLRWLFELLSISLIGTTLAVMYRIIPNAQVSWRDAFTGGIVAGVLFEIAKRIFTSYIVSQTTYASVYGAFSIIPIFLSWIFTSWLIVLAGAVITAYAPTIRARALPKPRAAGAAFIDAIGVLRTLHQSQLKGITMRNTDEIAKALQRDNAYVNELTHLLAEKNFIAEVEQNDQKGWSMVCNPEVTSVRPLAEKYVFSAVQTSIPHPQAARLLGEGANAMLAEWLRV